MHPELLPTLAAAHGAALRAAADRHRRVADLAPRPRRAIRRRAGWWMVNIGLHLALGRSGSPPRRSVASAS